MNSNIPNLTQKQEKWIYGESKTITRDAIDTDEKYISPEELIKKLDKFFKGV